MGEAGEVAVEVDMGEPLLAGGVVGRSEGGLVEVAVVHPGVRVGGGSEEGDGAAVQGLLQAGPEALVQAIGVPGQWQPFATDSQAKPLNKLI